MTKIKKSHYHTIVFTFFTKNVRLVLVDVVLLLHRRRLYFRDVPSFLQLRYDEEWVPWLFLGHSGH